MKTVKQTEREIDEIFSSDTVSYKRTQKETDKHIVVTSKRTTREGHISQTIQIIPKQQCKA